MSIILSLPLAEPSALRKPGSLPATTHTAGLRRAAPCIEAAQAEGTLVLVVDDHPTNRALLVRQVHTVGYAAESAEDGVEALARWKTGRFGIVITDCNMPEMDGYELARSIRRAEAAHPAGSAGKRTPIIACTAYALAGEAERCLAAGMDDYLSKPVELPQIQAKLDQWLPLATAEALPAADAQAIPIDRSVLAELLGGDDESERDILADFRRANAVDTAALERAVEANDAPQVTRATHRMLGASRMVGARELAVVCERIGQASRTHDWKAVAADMEALHRECSRLNAYVDAL